MNQDAAETSMRSEERKHDTVPSEQFAEFMKTGWSPSDREGLQPLEVVTYAYSRRQVLSSAFPGTRIVIKAGGFKVRANDTITTIVLTAHLFTTAVYKVLMQLLMLFWF